MSIFHELIAKSTRKQIKKVTCMHVCKIGLSKGYFIIYQSWGNAVSINNDAHSIKGTMTSLFPQ